MANPPDAPQSLLPLVRVLARQAAGQAYALAYGTATSTWTATGSSGRLYPQPVLTTGTSTCTGGW